MGLEVGIRQAEEIQGAASPKGAQLETIFFSARAKVQYSSQVNSGQINSFVHQKVTYASWKKKRPLVFECFGFDKLTHID